MSSRLRCGPAWLLGLTLLPLLACSENSPGEEDVTADGDEEVAALEMRAVVYGLTLWEAWEGAVWIRRSGDAAPVLVEALAGERPDHVCVNPDGTGYVVWKTFEAATEDPRHRTQTIAVGEEWVSPRAARPFPSGYNAVGCPFAWAPEAFIVDLTAETVYGAAPSDTRPYRVSVADDGFTLEAVEGVLGPWEREGPLILEARSGSESSSRDTEIVLWAGGVEPEPLVSWSAQADLSAHVEGPWLQLRSQDEETLQGNSISVVPIDDPLRPPLVLVAKDDPSVLRLHAWYSPSGEFVVAAQEFQEDRLDLEVLRIDGDAIVARHSIATDPDSLSLTRPVDVADSGRVLFVERGGEHLFVVPFGGAAQTIVRTDFAPGGVRVSGWLVDELKAVLVGELSSDSHWAYSLQSLDRGWSRPIQADAECGVASLRGQEAILFCPEGVEWVDLSALTPIAERLETLRPAGSLRPDSGIPFEWDGLPWYDFVFTTEDAPGYVRVLYQTDTQETMVLGEAGTDVSARAFLPPRSY